VHFSKDSLAYLLSFPFANWSLELEHSLSRPVFSQAVHAGSLPSHYNSSIFFQSIAQNTYLNLCSSTYSKVRINRELDSRTYTVSMQQLAETPSVEAYLIRDVDACLNAPSRNFKKTVMHWINLSRSLEEQSNATISQLGMDRSHKITTNT
jgi:hypothetical protein